MPPKKEIDEQDGHHQPEAVRQIVFHEFTGGRRLLQFSSPPTALSLPQNLLHGLALGEFIDQFVQISQLLHEGLLEVFDPDAADNTCYQGARGVQSRRLSEEGLKTRSVFELSVQPLRRQT